MSKTTQKSYYTLTPLLPRGYYGVKMILLVLQQTLGYVCPFELCFSQGIGPVAGLLKQSKCPSTDEWIKKIWHTHTHTHTHTLEYYSAMKRRCGDVQLFVEMWMDLESLIQSKVSQKEKNRYCVLTHICGI